MNRDVELDIANFTTKFPMHELINYSSIQTKL